MEEAIGYAERFGLDEILAPRALEALRPVRKEPGETLVRAGDEAEALFFLVEGMVKAYSRLENGRSVLAAFYEPFDVLGELELFSYERYVLSVEAMAASVFLKLPYSALGQTPDGNGRFYAFLCGRLGSKLANRVIAESINLRYPVENRLASYLLAATDARGRIVGGEDLEELADFIGSSYRQLARVLRDFRDRGILADSRGEIVVLDRGALRSLAKERYSRIWGGGSEGPGIGARGSSQRGGRHLL